MMVVAVPTKYKDALSSPGCEGGSFTCFGVGRFSGALEPVGRSRVAGRSSSELIEIRCMTSDSRL